MHYVKMIAETDTERDISQTLIKQLSNPTGLWGVIILNSEYNIF
jgi:hypothetical protein